LAHGLQEVYLFQESFLVDYENNVLLRRRHVMKPGSYIV
jgi:hypothetical protein